MRTHRWLAAFALFAAASAAAQEVHVFEREGFGGRRWVLNGDDANFGGSGLNNRISSIRVISGEWQFCTQPGFTGDCREFRRGDYPALGAQSNRYSSARVTGRGGRPPPPPHGGGGDVVLFDRQGFQRQIATLSEATPNFEPLGFNDAVASIIVRRGTWQFCTDAFYRGKCLTYGPGEYASLPGVDDRFSSARPVGGPPGPGPGPGPGHRLRLHLFDNPGFGGRTLVLDGRTENLDRTGFNDRAESMVVEGGEWIVCTDAHFRGRCFTYGPGRYDSLPRELRSSISSARPN